MIPDALIFAWGWVSILIVVAIPVAIIILVGYSVYTLRKPEGWEQK